METDDFFKLKTYELVFCLRVTDIEDYIRVKPRVNKLSEDKRK